MWGKIFWVWRDRTTDRENVLPVVLIEQKGIKSPTPKMAKMDRFCAAHCVYFERYFERFEVVSISSGDLGGPASHAARKYATDFKKTASFEALIASFDAVFSNSVRAFFVSRRRVGANDHSKLRTT